MQGGEKDRKQVGQAEAGILEGKKVLVTRPPDQARSFLDQLKALGAETIVLAAVDQEQRQLASPPDFITLTSPVAAKATLEGLEQKGWLRDSALVCIGPGTAATVRELGYEVAATADPYTTDGMIKALVSLASDDSHA